MEGLNAMSIVRINAITVPDGSGDELLRRFEARLGEVENTVSYTHLTLPTILLV